MFERFTVTNQAVYKLAQVIHIDFFQEFDTMLRVYYSGNFLVNS